MELARQLTRSSERARLWHYRTKDKAEVDAVLETADGRVIAIEVKAGATVRAEDRPDSATSPARLAIVSQSGQVAVREWRDEDADRG